MLVVDLKMDEGLPDKDQLLTEDSQARYQWVIDHSPISDSYAFPGGNVSLALYKASRYCFVYGHYTASIVLGLAYIERTISGWFGQNRQPELVIASHSTLFEKARNTGLIDEGILNIINNTRQKRNTLPPFYIKEQPKSDLNGYHPQADNHTSISENDARQLMGVMIHFIDGRTG